MGLPGVPLFFSLFASLALRGAVSMYVFQSY
jgi:hypothetical protein